MSIPKRESLKKDSLAKEQSEKGQFLSSKNVKSCGSETEKYEKGQF